MNVADVIANIAAKPNIEEVWSSLLSRREATFRGFAELEENNGLIKPKVNINTAKGQELHRLMLFRVLEELSESYESIDPMHRREEAIDAFNYLLSFMMLDPLAFSRTDLVANLNSLSYRVFDQDPLLLDQPLTLPILGQLTYSIAGRVPDFFRNRAWMNNPQHPYFEGHALVLAIFAETSCAIFSIFPDWDTFYRLFVAKDEVLQFRLRTRY
jgi:hypothetical protein